MEDGADVNVTICSYMAFLPPTGKRKWARLEAVGGLMRCSWCLA